MAKMLKLKNSKWINLLANLPESGMDYQIVDITLKNGGVMRNVFVFHCINIQLPSDFSNITEKNIADIKMSK